MSTIERRQEEKEQRRQDILDAAESVFTRKGIDKATMGDVAKEARLSRGLIYFYFKNKSDLELAISFRAIQMLSNSFEQAAAQQNKGLAKIKAIGQAYVHFFKTQPFYFDQLARHEARDVVTGERSENKTAYIQGGKRLLEILAGAIQTGIDDESIRSDVGDSMLTAVTLWAFTHGTLQVAVKKGPSLEDNLHIGLEDQIKHSFDLIHHALSCPSLTDYPAKPLTSR